jgi:MerR family transcriptional regulator/heat shock protein HspR
MATGDGRKRRGRGPGGSAEGLDRRRGVFMISVAAELAEMHPQTLRMYEARGLITPKRSPKNTRLYSYEDVERLRRIQQMTAEDGLNLAGVESVLALERELERARVEVARMRERASELERQMDAELERVRRSLRAEIVPYGAYEPPLSEAEDRVSIPIERPKRRRGSG